MSIKVNVLIKELSTRFGDEIEYTGDVMTTDGTRITESDWIDYINQAVLQILLIRPDANAVLQSVLLVEGTKQTIPDDGHVFIDIIRNMGEFGVTPGIVVVGADRASLDRFDPNWHTNDFAVAIKNYMFDKRFPRRFYVSPPVSDTTPVYVELAYCQMPDKIELSSENLPLTDPYYTPIKDWALNLAFSMDMDSHMNSILADKYQEMFYKELQVEFDSSMMIAPESTENTK